MNELNYSKSHPFGQTDGERIQDIVQENTKLRKRIAELENKLLAMQIQSNDFIGSLETKIFQFQHHVNRINGKGGDE